MSRGKEYKKFIEDGEFQEALDTLTDFKTAIRLLLTSRESSIRFLKKLKKEVEESYDKSRKARIGGTVGTVVGSGLAITGFGLSFVTFGASLALTVIGATMSAAGGITLAGADIGYLVVSQMDLKQAQKVLDVDREMMEKAQKINEKLDKLLESLEEKYPTIPKEGIWQMVRHCWQYGKPAGKALWSGYKLIDGTFDVARTTMTVISAAKTGAKVGGTTLWVGLSTAKRVAGVVGVAFDAVFIPVDLAFMIKAAVDVHKYRETGESNSAVAKTIGDLITKLEQHRDQVIENQP